tara:strand:- start:75 stop:278 length:204 start_codon:yes stop_codon:yes gene_type:complete
MRNKGLGASDASNIFPLKCKFCNTTKSVKYKYRHKHYCNRCILIVSGLTQKETEFESILNNYLKEKI